MNRLLLLGVFLLVLTTGYSQSTYYWVGGNPATPGSINTNTNWKTNKDGTGTSRPTSTGIGSELDVLVFDGTNLGGTTPLTGQITVAINGGINCAQMKFVNNANVVFVRTTTTTGTMTIKGGDGDDFLIESGSSLSINSTVGSVVFALEPNTSGRVNGSLSMVTTQQTRIAFTSVAGARSLVFTSGSKFTTNITGSSSYAFGSNTQASEKWVVFEPGSSLYFEGGNSPMGGTAYYSAIDFKPGSTWYHKAASVGGGSFFNRKSFANIVVEPGATLTADGLIHRIDNLTVKAGGTFKLATSGQTAVLGDLIVDGTLNADPTSTNNLILAGASTQTVSGSGDITIPSLIIADRAHVVLNKNITVNNNITVYGRLNFAANQLTGTATFTAKSAQAPLGATGNYAIGSYMITGTLGTLSGLTKGLGISDNGIAHNTSEVSASSFTTPTGDTIFLSRPTIGSGTNEALNVNSQPAVLETGNTNGFNPSAGSLIVSGNQTFEDRISYIINAATVSPFGLSTGAMASSIAIQKVAFNAAATTNASATIYGDLQLNAGKLTIRPLEYVKLEAGAMLTGTYNASQYIVTKVTASGDKGVLQATGISQKTLLPVGSESHYLPVTLTPASASDFAVTAFNGITIDGTPSGTPLTADQKKLVVDAIWDINRTSGSDSCKIHLQWPGLIEGSAFATFEDAALGIMINQNPNWATPVGSGNNTTDTAAASFNTFGRFAVGARPPSDPFVFNAIPAKTYGNPDFDAGVISANTTVPILLTSSNTGVATIVDNKIHITGTGTTDITASQASDGINPAATIMQSLTVNKADLTITADNKTKPEGDPNPALTASYSGFAYTEGPSVLTAPISITTTATTTSSAGVYPITVSGGAAVNYNLNYVNGTLTVTPKQAQTITFNAPAAKTYGNANFAIGATSTNTTIPITYNSSNPSVATIVGNNIRIMGAGTATITASQAGNDFYFPAIPVSRTLTVNKANLTVRAVDVTKAYGEPNPSFSITYTGFVNGESAGNLLAQPGVSTAATTNSAPGYYPLTLQGGVSNNYNFVYMEGRLTILPSSGTDQTDLQAFMSNSTTLTVRVYGTEPDLATLIIYDINGKPVVNKNIFLTKGFLNFTIPVSHLVSGTYTVSVKGAIVQLRKNITILR